MLVRDVEGGRLVAKPKLQLCSLPTTKTPVLGAEGCVLSFLLSQPPTVPVFRGGQEFGL